MDINDVMADIDANLPFVNKITISDGPASGPLHPSLMIGVAAALDCLSSHRHNRLIVFLPKRDDYALWVAFLATLWLMKKHFDLEFQAAKLSKGSKIKLNECIVEYLREELAPDGRTWLLWVQCRDGSYAFKLDREYTIVPFPTSRPLSGMKSVAAAYATAKEKGYELDHILNIRACGNLQLFNKCITIVSNKSKLENFVEKYNVNGILLKRLITWGKINKEGKPVSLSQDAGDGAFPTCIVSSNMFRLASFLEENKLRSPLEGILIDGIKFCEDGLQIIDDFICLKDIPTVVVADYSERNSLKYLLDRDFKILHLDSLLTPIFVNPSVSTSMPFTRYDWIFRNAQHLKIEPVIIRDCAVDALFKSLFELEKVVSEQAVKDCWLSLLYIALESCKRWSPPSQKYVGTVEQRITFVETQLLRNSMWMNAQLRLMFEECISALRSLISGLQRADNLKYTKIKEILEPNRQNKTVLLVSDEAEGCAAATFWTDLLKSSEGFGKPYQATPKISNTALEFLPVSQLGEKLSKSEFEVVGISGWPGRERFANILSTFAAPCVRLFIYEAEETWFKAANAEWERTTRITSDRSILEKTFKITQSLSPEKRTGNSQIPFLEETDVYLTLRNHQLSRYIAGPSEADVVKARYIRFAGNSFSFLSQTRMHYVVSDLIRHKSSSEIPKKRTDDLRAGDYILFMDSDRNIIREIVDSWLEKEGKSSLRETASIWRQSLIRKYDRVGRDLNQLSIVLARSGCTRTQVTLRKWLFDDDIIGPQDYDRDLLCIAQATGDVTLNSKIPEVKAAIANLRSLHLQAANIVRERCVSKLTSMLGNGSMSSSEAMTLDVENIRATILRIEEMGTDLVTVKPGEANRILVIENM